MIQIRGAPGKSAFEAGGNRGFFFQLLAPLKTMFSVRSSGQASHNISEFSLLGGKWNARYAAAGYDKVNPFVHTVVFTFRAPHPPLSWHLTYEQKQQIEDEWLSQENQAGCRVVMDFLAETL